MSSPGYGCEYCGGQHPVNWLVTHLNPAATLPVCDEDFPVAIIPVIAGELGVDAAGLYEAVKTYVDAQAADEAAEAAIAAGAPPEDSLPGPGPEVTPGSKPGPAGPPPASKPATTPRRRPAAKR